MDLGAGWAVVASPARMKLTASRLCACRVAVVIAVAAAAAALAPGLAWAANPGATKLTPRQKADALAAGLDPRKLGALRVELQRLVDARQIAGAVTVIGRRGRIGSLEVVGFADVEAKRPMREGTIFRIASMTKLITASAVLMLEDEGRLASDDPVEKYLPELRGQKLASARAGDGDATTLTLVDPPRPITIKDLLTHTAGLACVPPPALAPADDGSPAPRRTLAETVILLSQQPLERPPGTAWRYCGPSYQLLGRIVEVVGRKPFEQFLAERLFRPLGMRDTTFTLRPQQRRRLAALYQKAGDPTAVITRVPARAERETGPTFPSPADGLYSTARDYARFMQMLLDAGSQGGRRFLRPATVAAMTSVHFSAELTGTAGSTTGASVRVGFSPGLGMGLGPQVVMKPMEVTEALSVGSFGHGGAAGTHAWADPKNDIYYVLMIQRLPADDGDLSEVRRALQGIGAGAIKRLPTTPKPGLFTSRREPAPRAPK